MTGESLKGEEKKGDVRIASCIQPHTHLAVTMRHRHGHINKIGVIMSVGAEACRSKGEEEDKMQDKAWRNVAEFATKCY